jgi:hypothetical protein
VTESFERGRRVGKEEEKHDGPGRAEGTDDKESTESSC